MSDWPSLDAFNESDKRLTTSVHYLLIINGFLIAAYVALLTKGLSEPQSNNTIFFMSMQAIPPELITASFSWPSYNSILMGFMHLAVVLPLFSSVGFCIGVINAGIWPRQRKGYRVTPELIEREDSAIKLYAFATKLLGFGLIGLYSVSIIPFAGILPAIILWVVSVLCLVLLFVARGLFSKFY